MESRGIRGVTPLIWVGSGCEQDWKFLCHGDSVFLVSVMRRSESWRGWLVLKMVRSCYLMGSISVPARISINENASLRTTWHRADALVSHGEGFWKSVYERSRNGKECFGGSQS